MQSLLYDVGPRDPITITSVALILTSVALHACLGPALRASRINPVILYGMNDRPQCPTNPRDVAV
jgi:ABC-type lipoprotein release transport system permease subunit